MIKRKANKKRVIRIVLFSVVFAAIAFWVFSITYSKPIKNKETNFIYDEMNIFSESQEESLNNLCLSAQKTNKLKIYISTCERINEKASKWGTDILKERKLSYDDNVVIIIINFEEEGAEYFFDIYTYGKSATKITDDEYDIIMWSEGGDYIKLSTPISAVIGLKDIIKQIRISYTWILTDTSWWLICGGSLIIGMIVAFIVIKAVKKSYSKQRKVENYEFNTNTKMDLRVRQDTFIRKNVTSVIIPKIEPSNSGGGSSGRSSGGRGFGGGISFGGGRSGGGGAGHRGGR